MYRRYLSTRPNCPVCGRTVYDNTFEGYCSSACVEIEVDENIMREQDYQQWREDRLDRYNY